MSQDLVPLVQTRRRSDWLVNQLPVGMVDDPADAFFLNFVRIFQTVATTIVEGVDNLEHIIDVTVAPTPMVRWLGTWLGVDDVDSSLSHEVQRRIVARSSHVLAWRGTRRGLVDFLELISGAPAEVTDTGGVFAEGQAPFVVPTVWIRVASSGWVPEEDFVVLVRRELPANVACEIHIGDRRLWPVDGSGPSLPTDARAQAPPAWAGPPKPPADPPPAQEQP